MDIEKLAEVSEDEGVEVHLRNRDGALEYEDAEQTKPVVMTVAGQFSKRYKKAVRVQQERNLKKRSFNIDVDYLEQAPLEIEAACIVEWPFTSGGKPFPITSGNWSAILSRCPWYQAQVRDGIERYASFFENASTS